MDHAEFPRTARATGAPTHRSRPAPWPRLAQRWPPKGASDALPHSGRNERRARECGRQVYARGLGLGPEPAAAPDGNGSTMGGAVRHARDATSARLLRAPALYTDSIAGRRHCWSNCVTRQHTAGSTPRFDKGANDPNLPPRLRCLLHRAVDLESGTGHAERQAGRGSLRPADGRPALRDFRAPRSARLLWWTAGLRRDVRRQSGTRDVVDRPARRDDPALTAGSASQARAGRHCPVATAHEPHPRRAREADITRRV